MNIQYIRDLNHNYLVLKTNPLSEDPYTARVLDSNRITGLLHASRRQINEEVYLYYEADALKSIYDRFYPGKMGEASFRALLHALKALEKELSDYLVGTEHVLLSADTVFTDAAGKRFYFICTPEAEGQRAGIGMLLEEMLELADMNDTGLAKALYPLCEKAQGWTGMFSALFSERTDPEEAPAVSGDIAGEGRGGTVPGTGQMPPGVKERGPDADRYAENEAIPQPSGFVMEEDAGTGDSEAEPSGNGTRGNGWRETGRRRHIVTGLLFLAVLVADLYIRMHYLLSPVENVLSLAVIAIAVPGALVSVIFFRRGDHPRFHGGVRTKKKKRGRRSERKEQYADETAGILPFDEQDLGRYELVRSTDPGEDPQGAEKDSAIAMPGSAHAVSGYGSPLSSDAGRSPEEEETVVLTPQMSRRAGKLYGRDNESNVHIPLDRLPMTLGKLAGCADFVLGDQTISRLHARILKNEAQQIEVRDLNSTNGTFLNGMRLLPNESVPIRPGDEICFGNMVFDYR